MNERRSQLARPAPAEEDAARWLWWKPWIERRVGDLAPYEAQRRASTPAPVSAQGDERKAFESWLIARQRAAGCGAALTDAEFTVRDTEGKYTHSFEFAWAGWQARATCARADEIDAALAPWLSAAISDPNTCEGFRALCERWFAARAQQGARDEALRQGSVCTDRHPGGASDHSEFLEPAARPAGCAGPRPEYLDARSPPPKGLLVTPAQLEKLARETMALADEYASRESILYNTTSEHGYDQKLVAEETVDRDTARQALVDGIARFAALVRAAALGEAAGVCEEIGDAFQERESGRWPELKSDAQTGARDCEAALRALAQQAGGEAT